MVITKRSKWYVGLKGVERILFFANAPVTQEAERYYGAVIGPFRTKRAAIFSRDCGYGNPHCQCVQDAERISKRIAEERRACAKSLDANPNFVGAETARNVIAKAEGADPFWESTGEA